MENTTHATDTTDTTDTTDATDTPLSSDIVDINIPIEMEQYKELIDKIVEDYSKLVKEIADGFDGGDIMLFINTITHTVAHMKHVVENFKEVDGDDRIVMFNIVLSLVIKKAILSNDKLSESTKQQVEAVFAAGGLVQTILNAVRNTFKKIYTDMDTSKDGFVSKYEYQKYIEKSNAKRCGCCGESSNKNCAKCFTACCFPILSCCNPKGIKIPK